MSIFNLFGGMIGLYKVVPPDEAHVRVMSNKQEVFMSDDNHKSGYWQIPFISVVQKVPLTNLNIFVKDIKLNDKNMAPFQCDINCFFNVSDPITAVKRTGITIEQARFEGSDISLDTLPEDFRAIIEGTIRGVATNQTLLDVYMKREILDKSVSAILSPLLPAWGLGLVDLEIRDIKDIQGSTIIADIERKIAAEISADARVKVAEQNARAQVTEAEQQKKAELEIAKNEEEWQKRRIEKERTVAIAEADKSNRAATELNKANTAIVAAEQKLIVGRAENEKLKIQKESEATKIQIGLLAEANANKINIEGSATADIIRKTKLAEAEGLDKLAIAQSKYNEAAINIESIKASRDVQLGYAKAYGEALSNADVKIVAGSTQEIMSGGVFGNIRVGAKEGAAYDQFRYMGGQLPIQELGKDLTTTAAGVMAADSIKKPKSDK